MAEALERQRSRAAAPAASRADRPKIDLEAGPPRQ
jgi:hypothetical protein